MEEGGAASAERAAARGPAPTAAIAEEFAHMPVCEMFGKLRILAALRTGEKLSFAPMRLDPPGMSSSLVRWWNNEGRMRTVAGLRALYERALCLAAELQDTQVSEQLLCLIERSVTSMERLRGTYRDDQTTTCTLSGLQDTVELKLVRVRSRVLRRAPSDPVDIRK